MTARNIASWRVRMIPALVLMVGGVLSVLAFFQARNVESDRVHNVLELRAEWRAADLQSKIREAANPVRTIAQFIPSQQTLDPAEFHRLAVEARADSPVAVLNWAPLVRDADRGRFEADAQREGHDGYRISVAEPDGQMRVEGERETYLPARLIERFDGLRPNFGLDPLSDKQRAAAIGQARDSGEPVAAPPLPQLRNPGSPPYYLVFWPVYAFGADPKTVAERQASFIGMVAAPFPVDGLLRFAILNSRDAIATLSLFIDHPENGGFGVPMAAYDPDAKRVVLPRQPLPDLPPAGGVRTIRTFSQFGHQWTLVSDYPASAVGAFRSSAPLAYLGFGLLLTLGLAAHLFAERRRRAAVEKEIVLRTGDLQATSQKLNAILEASPIAIATYDTDQRVTSWNRATEEITGYKAEEMIGGHLPAGLSGALEDLAEKIEPVTHGEAVRGLEVNARHRNGETFSVQVAMAGLFDPEGKLTGFVTVAEDITERRRAERLERQTQELLAGIVASSNDAMISKTLDGTVTSWNQAAETIFGYRADEMLGRPISVLAIPGNESDMLEVLNKIRQGERVEHYQTQRRRKDGSILDVSLTVSPIHDTEGRIIGASKIVRDITAQRRADEALRKGEERYRATFEIAPIGIIHVAPDGRFIMANRFFCNMLGYRADELLSMSALDITHPEDVKQTLNRLEVVRSGEITKRYIGKGGREVWCEITYLPQFSETGVHTHNISIVDDITERRAAESRLRLLAEAFEQSGEAIIVTGTDLRIVDVNRAFTVLTGYQPDEVIGKNPAILAPPGLSAEDGPSPVLERAGFWRGEKETRRKDGTTFIRSGAISSVRDATGKVTHYVGSYTDVSETKAREAHRVQLEAQLQQAQKMESIGQLTGGLAHDFNNLLGVILGNLDFLEENASEESGDRRLIQAAIKAAVRGADLTRSLLAFARRQPLAPQLTDVHEVLKAAGQLFQRTLGENVVLELGLRDGLWPVMIDVAQLESAMLNLAVNARDAMSAGGKLVIEASNVTLDEAACERNAEAVPGDYLVISVSDTGVGMPPEVAAKVFDPFFTTKGAKGTGLGLSMVHGFVKQSGGHTRIYSEIGRGTTIRIYLPRAAAGSGAEAEDSNQAAPPGTEAILVVEDNEGLREVVVKRLADFGYRTVAVGDAAEALEILRQGVPFDLLFTDIVMPGAMDGRALADAARVLLPHMKVLFTSGYTEAAASAAMASQFGSNLLTKPYRKDELARRVRAAIDGDV